MFVAVSKRETLIDVAFVRSPIEGNVDDGIKIETGFGHFLFFCLASLQGWYEHPTEQEKSKKELSEMGITRFEMFTYLIDKERESISKKLCRLKEEFRKIATRGIIDEE